MRHDQHQACIGRSLIEIKFHAVSSGVSEPRGDDAGRACARRVRA
jgi:hypothetical protein